MILVIGATGRVGGAAVRELLAMGKRVRVLVRSEEGEVAFSGCEIVRGDLTRKETLAPAVNGVDAVVDCVGTPRGPKTTAADYRRVTQEGNANLIDALVATDQKPRFVYVSSYNADRARYFVDFDGKILTEEKLFASGLPFTILRPSGYMESVATEFVQNGVANVAGAFDRPVNLISARDVGAAAARVVDRPDLVGRTVALFGPERTTFIDAVHAYGRASGKKLTIRKMPLGAFKVLTTVLSPWQPVMPNIYQLVRSLNELDWSGDPKTLREILGREPTRAEEVFAQS